MGNDIILSKAEWLAPAPRARTPADLTDALWERLERDNDYPAVGGVCQAVLLRDGQHEAPDDLSLLVAQNVKRVAAALFGVSHTLSYRMAAIHECASWEVLQSNPWSAVYHQLHGFCFALGCYNRVLPRHLAKYLEFWLALADELHHDIRAAAERARQSPRALRPGPDGAGRLEEAERAARRIQEEGRRMGLPAAKIEFEMQYARRKVLGK